MKGSSALQISLLNLSERVKDLMCASGVADTGFQKRRILSFLITSFQEKNEVR